MQVLQSPFKFLDAYEKEDEKTFFGRDREVDALYELIFETKLILLYGASGVGKTSIIRCGLANRFRSAQWMEMFVRKEDDINKSLHRSVEARIRQSNAKAEVPENILDALQMLYLYNFIPVYLIFDQFEELFIFGTEPEQHDFFQFIQDILKSELPVKVLLSMREEYIAQLSTFEKLVPSLFDHRIRVEPMPRTSLVEVIEGTTKAHHIEILQPDITIDAILNNLSDNKRGVDLTNLQVYLDRLYRKDLESKGGLGEVSFDPGLVERVGELKDVLGDFLDEQLIILEMELGKKGVPLTVLFELVTDQGTKQSKDTDKLKDSLFRRKDINPEDVEHCIRRFLEMRIFKDLEE